MLLLTTLGSIQEQGELRVGTTGDYPPFSHLVDGHYEGYDIELASLIAKELGVEVHFVPTTWKTLVDDQVAGRFDLAVGGITRTDERAARVGFTQPTFTIGKCPLMRRGASFRTLQDVDRPGVRVAVNPGGTNERFAREHFQRATLVPVADNLAIPAMIASGEADLLVTDNLEAERASRLDERLACGTELWTHETLGLMAPRDDQNWLDWLDRFLSQKEADGTLRELRGRYGLPAETSQHAIRTR